MVLVFGATNGFGNGTYQKLTKNNGFGYGTYQKLRKLMAQRQSLFGDLALVSFLNCKIIELLNHFEKEHIVIEIRIQK